LATERISDVGDQELQSRSGKYQRQNAHKVDLNRNGTYLWQGTALSREYYPGPAPASEPETKAYISFLEAVKPDVVLIYHQHGNGVDSYRQKNAGLTQGLAARMKLAVKSFDCLGECRGTLAGWFNTSQAGAALTVELPAKVTTKRVKVRSAALVNARGRQSLATPHRELLSPSA
jgi:protein MpaA